MGLFAKPDPTKPAPTGTPEGAAPAAPSAPGANAPAAPPTPDPKAPAAKPIPALAVRAIPAAGFCRAGRRWTPEVQVVALAEFSKDQVKALRAESALVVEDVEIAPEPEA